MLVTVHEYLESHELACFVTGDMVPYKIITIDPFVTCAVDSPDDSFREVGQGMVGKIYKMDGFYINGNGVYLPDEFTEVG